jgi:hypothetical protein
MLLFGRLLFGRLGGDFGWCGDFGCAVTAVATATKV